MADTVEISSAPECAGCSGYCCENFYAFAHWDGSPGAEDRARSAIKDAAPDWELTGDPIVMKCSTQVRFKSRCTKHTAEGCSIYNSRPAACKMFPTPEVASEIVRKAELDGVDPCPLAVRVHNKATERMDEDSIDAKT